MHPWKRLFEQRLKNYSNYRGFDDRAEDIGSRLSEYFPPDERTVAQEKINGFGNVPFNACFRFEKRNVSDDFFLLVGGKRIKSLLCLRVLRQGFNQLGVRTDGAVCRVERNRQPDLFANTFRRVFEHFGIDIKPPGTAVPDQRLLESDAIDRAADGNRPFVFTGLCHHGAQYVFRHKHKGIDADNLQFCGELTHDWVFFLDPPTRLFLRCVFGGFRVAWPI